MKRFTGGLIVAAMVLTLTGTLRALAAGDGDAILDKAVQAMGGADKLKTVRAASWDAKGTITFNGADNAVTMHSVLQGLDHSRQEFSGTFGGNEVKSVTVLAGDKGWRVFGGNRMDMDAAAVTAEKRRSYLSAVPINVLALRGHGFQFEAAGEEKVADRPAAVLKVTGPDGKEFRLLFDRESGLPVKLIARVPGFQGNDFNQETTFSDYRDVDGLKKAFKMVSTRNGEKFITQEISGFKVLETVDPKTFEAP